MKTSTQSDDPAKRPQPASDRGLPVPHSAQAIRENVAVRVTVPPGESDELREHGYGHGV